MAVNNKYLKKRYLNFPALRSNPVGTGKLGCPTLVGARSRHVPHQRRTADFQSSLCQSGPGAGAPGTAANTSHASPCQTGWPKHRPLEFNTQCPALTTELSWQRKHRSAHPRWPKSALFPQTQVENPLKAEWLKENYSFGTKLQVVNIKLRCARNKRNEWLCMGEERKGNTTVWAFRHVDLTAESKKLDANEIINNLQ